MGTYRRPLRSDELMHFGVKGMKWRFHKAKEAKEEMHDLYLATINNPRFTKMLVSSISHNIRKHDDKESTKELINRIRNKTIDRLQDNIPPVYKQLVNRILKEVNRENNISKTNKLR